MKNKYYDYVFITNIPSFYKINLYNALAKYLSVYVIFIAKKSEIRADDFFNKKIDFDHSFINDGVYESRSKITTLLKVISKFKKIDYKYTVFPGWEIKELLFLSYLLPKSKNAVVVESSILETKQSGLPWILKRLFLSRMDVGLPSGILQREIFDKIGFKGLVKYTHGVGILNDEFHNSKRSSYLENKELKYLYVGRLSPEKNLELLCKTFKDNKKNLTLIGYGPLYDSLIKDFGAEITFEGAINNKDLIKYYLEHDVLILPSKSEVWGLVIEEALSCGLVIIVSDRVGSKDDLVISKETGVTFEYSSQESLNNAIEEIEGNFNFYFENVKKLDSKVLTREKVFPYIELIK